MNNNKHFEMNRFIPLLKMEYVRIRRPFLMILSICIELLLLCILVAPLCDTTILLVEHKESFAFSFLLGGFILSSLAFSDLSHKQKRKDFLTLPVSSFERLVCMWLLTSVMWIVIFVLCHFVYSIIANLIGPVIFDYIEYEAFDPFGSFALITIKWYFLLQGIFLIGATQFRRFVFPKTLVVIAIIALVWRLGSFLIIDEAVNESIDGSSSNILTDYAMVWLIGPATWILCYLGLKRLEE